MSGAARREARKKALEDNGAVINTTLMVLQRSSDSGIKEEYLDDVLVLVKLWESCPDATSSNDLPDEEAMQIVVDAVNAKIIENTVKSFCI